ncbi:MAG: helix-turn-helix domain-containing protein [Bdellovibrio sp.]|jgi:cytoskeleton protein RodZ
MSKLGQFLKNAREKKSLSLHEIGLSLKINPKILSALEDGQKEDLPAKTFLRGFVKSYAQYLRLDNDEVLRLFSEEYGVKAADSKLTLGAASSDTPTAPTAVIRPRQNEEASLSQKQSKIFLVGGGILFFVLIVFVAKMVEKYQKERTIRPLKIETGAPVVAVESTPVAPAEGNAVSMTPGSNAPPVDSSVPALMTASAPPPDAMTIPAATLTPSPTASPSPTPSPTLAPSPTATPMPTVTPSPTARPTATPSPAPSPTPSTTSSPAPSPTPTASPSPEVRPTEVILEALSRVTVKYTLIDGKTQSLELSADKLHTIRSKGTVLLELSDGGAVNLIVNGRDRGVPGSIGQPLKLSLPQ